MTLQEAITWCDANNATVEFGGGLVFLTTSSSGMMSGPDLPNVVAHAIKQIARIEEKRLVQQEKEYKRYMDSCQYLFD